MPTYEYACSACDHRFEQRQSFHDDPIKVCPQCGGETRRVYFPTGIIFKGSGWYITDSRKGSGSSSESKSESKSESSSESKSDSKVSSGT